VSIVETLANFIKQNIQHDGKWWWNPANHNKLTKAPKQKKGENKEQNGRTHTSQKTNRPPKSANHKGTIKFPNPPPVMRSISNNERGKSANNKGTIKFPNPLLSWEAYQIMKGEKRRNNEREPKSKPKKQYPRWVTKGQIILTIFFFPLW
jgi:hypothetical protein